MSQIDNVEKEYTSENYFESLCAEEEQLHNNYAELKSILNLMKELTNEEASDEELISKLKGLEKARNLLLQSVADLRISKFNVRDAEVYAIETNNLLKDKKITNSDLVSDRYKDIEGMTEYIETVENLNVDLMTYSNLLGRLSVDLIQQIQVANAESNEIIINDYSPPSEIVSILEKFNTETTETDELRNQVDDYLQKIKMDRAKYTLENEYSLKDSLDELTKEVNYWRKEYDNLEMLMFSDRPNTIMKMMKNIETLRSKIKDSNTLKK